jgi:hypothetical protein
MPENNPINPFKAPTQSVAELSSVTQSGQIPADDPNTDSIGNHEIICASS